MDKASLIDLAGAEAPAKITLRGRSVPVMGLPIAVIARFMRDCPAVADLLSKGGAVSIDVGEILKSAPESAGMLIAAGLGHYGDPDVEQAMNRLSMPEQIDVLQKILEATMPGGVGPFVERLKGLAKSAGVDVAKLIASNTN